MVSEKILLQIRHYRLWWVENFGVEPNCMAVALMLKRKYGCEILYDGDHVVAYCWGAYYDEEGVYEGPHENMIGMENYGDHHYELLWDPMLKKINESLEKRGCSEGWGKK